MKTIAAALLLLLGQGIAASAAEKAVVLAATGQEMAAPSTSQAEAPKSIAFGIYDPHKHFAKDPNVQLEHFFVAWQAMDYKDFNRRLADAKQLGRSVMVTIEPYTKAPNWRDGGERLFADIVTGKFDGEIENICSSLAKFRGLALVRWGHEMEDPNGRYPWARSDSQGYKSAFQYFVTACRHIAPGIKTVWSPKGEKNLSDYFPGREYVDFIGVSVWGLESYDTQFYGGARDFSETFNGKYRRIAKFGAPVIIAKLGVSGRRSYREQWFESLRKAVAGKREFPELQAVVYFNDKEPYHWPFGLGSPDWHISTDWFSQITVPNNSTCNVTIVSC